MVKKKRDFDPSTDMPSEASMAIDPNRLDEQWSEQPQLYFKYATLLAERRKEYEEARIELKIIESTLKNRVRKNPQKYGLAKITEAGITQVVESQPKVEEAMDRITELKYELDLLAAVCTSLDHRKKALEGMVFLHGQNYFAVPSERRIKGTKKPKRRQRD